MLADSSHRVSNLIDLIDITLAGSDRLSSVS